MNRNLPRQLDNSTMLPAPFYTEVPHDLGDDVALWGRDLVQLLLRLRRHEPTYHCPETANDQHALPSPAAAPLYPRERNAKSTPCRGRLEYA